MKIVTCSSIIKKMDLQKEEYFHKLKLTKQSLPNSKNKFIIFDWLYKCRSDFIRFSSNAKVSKTFKNEYKFNDNFCPEFLAFEFTKCYISNLNMIFFLKTDTRSFMKHPFCFQIPTTAMWITEHYLFRKKCGEKHHCNWGRQL